jgi:hypothetical protein
LNLPFVFKFTQSVFVVVNGTSIKVSPPSPILKVTSSPSVKVKVGFEYPGADSPLVLFSVTVYFSYRYVGVLSGCGSAGGSAGISPFDSTR